MEKSNGLDAMPMTETLRNWARRVRREVAALAIAARDPRTPWLAKALAMLVAAYAMSPIDLVPDFIPVLGYLDDVLLVPLGIILVVRLIPADLMAEFRLMADSRPALPTSRLGAVLVVSAWIAGIAAIAWWLWLRPAPPIPPLPS
jgi:uncharacterized membrane protein YkvA (DUF1232 family)